MDHAYWGPQFDDAAIGSAAGLRAPTTCAARAARWSGSDDEAALCQRAAEADRRRARSSAGSRAAWNGGRARWATAPSSCDPRRADMKDILNLKIKRRESFRPFAPSILREAVGEWFEEDGDVPFMMQVFQIREEQARAHPGGDPRRRLRPPADRPSRRPIRATTG